MEMMDMRDIQATCDGHSGPPVSRHAGHGADTTGEAWRGLWEPDPVPVVHRAALPEALMGCKITKDGSGQVVKIICSRGPQSKSPCVVCNKPGGYLCDFQIKNGITCDKSVCGEHRQHRGPEIDYCPMHAYHLCPGCNQEFPAMKMEGGYCFLCLDKLL